MREWKMDYSYASEYLLDAKPLANISIPFIFRGILASWLVRTPYIAEREI